MHIIQHKVVAAAMDDQVVSVADCDSCTGAGARRRSTGTGLAPRPARELQQQQVICAATSRMSSCSTSTRMRSHCGIQQHCNRQQP
jgi:hypothetical protein